MKTVLEIARESGVSGVTMRQVAARTGVSESAAYHHFDSKADLLAAGALLAFGHFTDALRDGVNAHRGGDPVIGLSAGYVTFALGDPGAYQLIFGRHVVDAGLDTRQDVRTAGGATIELAYSALGESLKNRNKQTSAEEAFPMVRAILHGVVALVTENELEVDMPTERAVRLATRTVDALLNGLP